MKKISPQIIKQYLNSVFEKTDLNGIIGSDGIRNINIFSHEVVIDLSILNPTLQAKKKLESLIETAVLKNFENFSKVVVNFFVVKEEKAPLIKGKAIKNIKNIVAVASKSRNENQPFFSVFNLPQTHESKIWQHNKKDILVDIKKISPPPYFPNDSVIIKDMAINYSNLILMDEKVGE